MKTLLIAAVAVVAAHPVLAQDLTKAQEARMALGQCYSACFNNINTLAFTAAEATIDLYWAMWRDSASMTQQQWREFVAYHNSLECVAAQTLMSSSESCYRGCIDVQQAFGSTSSSARSAYLYEYRQNRDELRKAGLWRSYNNYPKPGTSQFQTACDRYQDNLTSGSGNSPVVQTVPLDQKVKQPAPDQ